MFHANNEHMRVCERHNNTPYIKAEHTSLTKSSTVNKCYIYNDERKLTL